MSLLKAGGDGCSDTRDPPDFAAEVDRIVAEAAAERSILRVGEHARRLSELEGAGGVSKKSIADALIRAASKAGVAVEMDSTD
jgi:hypothetical protein